VNVGLLNIRILFERAQVYHAHNTMFLLGMFLASRLHGGKLVYDAHEVQCEAGRLQAWLEKIFIYKVDAIINVSEGRAGYQAIQYGLPLDRITVIHNYPELTAVQIQTRQPSRRIRMVFSGGFHLEDNRLDVFLRMLVGIPDVELDLIAFGYGDSGDCLERLIKELKLQEAVRFLPLVPFNVLIPTLASYDVAVDMLTNPERSVSKRYPAINKTYEYFAAGLPIICSNMEAFVEEVDGQGAGISIDLSQQEQGRRKLSEFIADHDRLATMQANARRLSEQKYNWTEESARLQALYSILTRE
jgi:glycosyltransferase involved in cell wall biosynthesis